MEHRSPYRVLILGNDGQIPDAASAKAVDAYGSDIWRDAKGVVDHLGERPTELDEAASTIRMDLGRARKAIAVLALPCERALVSEVEREIGSASMTA